MATTKTTEAPRKRGRPAGTAPGGGSNPSTGSSSSSPTGGSSGSTTGQTGMKGGAAQTISPAQLQHPPVGGIPETDGNLVQQIGTALGTQNAMMAEVVTLQTICSHFRRLGNQHELSLWEQDLQVAQQNYNKATRGLATAGRA